MLRTTHALSALIVTVLIASCSLLDFSAFEETFRRTTGIGSSAKAANGGIARGTESGAEEKRTNSGLRQQAEKVSSAVVSAGLDLMEEEAATARVGLREYYQDLDRCILMVWMPEMTVIPSWQYTCLRPVLDAPADAYGNRLLHIAARSGNREALELLLELGAHPDELNLMGQTARDVLKCHDGVSRYSMIAALDGLVIPAPRGSQPARGVLATRPVQPAWTDSANRTDLGRM